MWKRGVRKKIERMEGSICVGGYQIKGWRNTQRNFTTGVKKVDRLFWAGKKNERTAKGEKAGGGGILKQGV